MDPLQIASFAASAAKGAWEVGHALYMFSHDVSLVDQTVSGLITEVRTLGSACSLVDERLRDIVRDHDDATKASTKKSRLWSCIEVQITDSQKTITQLEIAVNGVCKEEKNILAQIWRTIKLNLKTKDISEARHLIRSHTASLQMVLQTVAIEIYYLAPQKADQQLRTLLGKVEDCMEQLKALRTERVVQDSLNHAREVDLLEIGQETVSNGESLFAASVANGSIIGGLSPADRSAKVHEWMQDLNAIDRITSLSDVAETEVTSTTSSDGPKFTDPSRSSTASTDYTEILERPPSDGEYESEDEFLVEAAKEALAAGRSSFQAADFVDANVFLQEALKMVRQLPVRQQTICDTWEVRYMLGVCAFATQQPADAEADLLSIIDNASRSTLQNNEQRLQLCEVGHLLALVYVRIGKLDQARLSCENAMKGRQRLLGMSHTRSYESLALMARVLQLQGNAARSKIYLRMIPDNETISFQDLDLPFKDRAFSDSTLESREDTSVSGDKSAAPRPDEHEVVARASGTLGENMRSRSTGSGRISPASANLRSRSPGHSQAAKRPSVAYAPPKKIERMDSPAVFIYNIPTFMTGKDLLELFVSKRITWPYALQFPYDPDAIPTFACAAFEHSWDAEQFLAEVDGLEIWGTRLSAKMQEDVPEDAHDVLSSQRKPLSQIPTEELPQGTYGLDLTNDFEYTVTAMEHTEIRESGPNKIKSPEQRRSRSRSRTKDNDLLTTRFPTFSEDAILDIYHGPALRAEAVNTLARIRSLEDYMGEIRSRISNLEAHRLHAPLQVLLLFNTAEACIESALAKIKAGDKGIAYTLHDQAKVSAQSAHSLLNKYGPPQPASFMLLEAQCSASKSSPGFAPTGSGLGKIFSSAVLSKRPAADERLIAIRTSIGSITVLMIESPSPEMAKACRRFISNVKRGILDRGGVNCKIIPRGLEIPPNETSNKSLLITRPPTRLLDEEGKMVGYVIGGWDIVRQILDSESQSSPLEHPRLILGFDIVRDGFADDRSTKYLHKYHDY